MIMKKQEKEKSESLKRSLEETLLVISVDLTRSSNNRLKDIHQYRQFYKRSSSTIYLISLRKREKKISYTLNQLNFEPHLLNNDEKKATESTNKNTADDSICLFTMTTRTHSFMFRTIRHTLLMKVYHSILHVHLEQLKDRQTDQTEPLVSNLVNNKKKRKQRGNSGHPVVKLQSSLRLVITASSEPRELRYPYDNNMLK
ncbi:hypothetical protein BDC45DRAFT_533046 [Circinella umbellata]|nr:hypothetical protein BDC45DRAFT_533046 [Circinella umbellata]